MKKRRRLLSGLLALCMIFTETSAPAVTAKAEERVIPLEASRLAADKLPDGNLVYFGSAAASLPEKEAVYSVPIYREGDLSGEASVEVHAIDLMALYGEDYEFVQADPEVTGSKETILERYSRENAEFQAEDEFLESESPSSKKESAEPEKSVESEEERAEPGESAASKEEATEPEKSAASKEEDTKSQESIETEQESKESKDSDNTSKAAKDSDNAATDTNVDGYVSLAELKEQKTGLPTREVTKGESDPQSFVNNAVNEMVPDAMSGLDASAKVKVTFAPGENEKQIKFRIKDDDKPEGQEAFTLLLTDPENAEVYQVTSLSVIIEDDEQTERSKVSFTQPEYVSEDGKAVVTIKREGAEYSIADLEIRSSGDTAKAGVNYNEVHQAVAFAPYEMEKKVEIPVAGQGRFEVVMSEFGSCEAGELTRATISVQEDAGIQPQSDSGIQAQAASSFDISINSKNYRVEYNWGDAKGKIMDTAYNPAVWAGEYYFPTDAAHGGIFSYAHWDGNKPGGTRNSHYQQDNGSDMSQNYGKLYYYDWRTTKKGRVWTESSEVPAIYYRYVAPDWAMTAKTYGGQRCQFRLQSTKSRKSYDTTQDVTGQFDRTRDKGIIQIGDETNRNSDGLFRMYAYSIDQEKNKTPKSYLNFYGAAAMFKRYDVSLEAPEGKTFLTPTGKTDPIEPVQAEVKCGAQLLYQHESRAIYPNPETSGSNLVFTLKSSHVNGHDGKYGSLSGYKITVGTGGNNATTLNYPKDFISFLNSRKNSTKGYIDYGKKAVENEINRINKNLDTIPFDCYFIDWIESEQVNTSSDGNSYKQLLKFKPIYNYNDVKVNVLAARGGSGQFKNSQLQAGRKVTFHAGDLLDLSMTPGDSMTRVAGYDVSTDGGQHFDTVTSTSSLFLESSTEYTIRPVFEKDENHIEIIFADDTARNNLKVEETIPQSELISNSLFRGRTILNLNPQASTVQGKMKPTVGQDYTVRIKVTGKPKRAGYVYRPVIKDNMTGQSYNTQTYYMNARSRKEDNTLTVSVVEVKESELRNYTVEGNVVSAIKPILDDGQALKELPVANMSVMVGQGQDASGTVTAVAAQTDSNGEYSLMDVKGMPNDRIPVLISNGIGRGQIAEIVLPDVSAGQDGVCHANIGKLTMKYPSGIPKVTDISYNYNNAANNQSSDNTHNSINIFDDTLNITASVDLAGRKIEEAIFTVYSVEGTKTEYHAYPSDTDKGKFKFSIEKMVDNLRNGDRISVRLVDSQKYTMMLGGSNTSTVNMEYPDVDTGIVFYTENVLSVPQYYETSPAPTVNVPIVGAANGHANTGLLAFSKTYWDDSQSGYTLDINISGSATNKGSKSEKEKLESLNKYKKAVETDKKANKLNAENIMLQQEFENTSPNDADRGMELGEQIEENEKLFKELGGNNHAKDMRAGMTDAKVLSGSVNVMLSLEFIRDSKGDYLLCYGAVTIGGTFKFNKSFYTAISFVPCFFNLNGTLQVNLAFGASTPDARDAYTEGEFQSLSGNIAEVFGDAGLDTKTDIMFKGTGQVGVGLCGVLSARGYVSIQLQFDVGTSGNDVGLGFLIGTEGGIGFDILVGTININLFTAQVGVGTLEGKTSYSFFGGLVQDKIKSAGRAFADTNGQDVKVLSKDDKTITTYREADAGTADMSAFGKNRLRASLEADSMTTLLSPAAEHTRPQITLLDGGKKLITFIGNGGKNTHALFYSVYDGTKWSEPKQVADDGTMDSVPDILNLGSKVIIAWADADKTFAADDAAKDKLSSMGISLAVYDVQTGVMSEERTIVKDAYCNLAPQLSESGGNVYCSYMKRDLKDVESEEDILDMEGIYSTMAYVKYPINGKALGAEEEFVTIEHPTITDPLVFDYHMETIEIGGDSYLVSAYTIDEDGSLSTGGDRGLWMKLKNLTTGKEYYPMQIEQPDSAASAPKLNELDGRLYLSYLTNGNTFGLLDVSGLLEDIFTGPTETGADLVSADVSVYKNADAKDQNWYKKTAADLKMTAEGYEHTIYDKLTRGEFEVDKTGLKQREESESAGFDYTLTSNGKDLYLFFTDVSSKDNGTYSTGRELYGMRYHRKDDNAVLGDTQTDTEDGGFFAASQITDYNKVIDEMDVVMTEDNRISVVSNYYEQGIGADGGIQYGDNTLVELDFEPVSSIDLKPGSISSEEMVVGEETQVTFEAQNTGMIPAEDGFEYRITKFVNGKETELVKGESDKVLEPGESEEIHVPVTPEGEKADMELRFYLHEKGTAELNEPSDKVTVKYESILEFTESEIAWEDGGANVTAEIENNGRKASEPAKGTLYSVDREGKKLTSYGTFDVPALASGETHSIALSFVPKASDFSDLGIMELELDVSSGDKVLANDRLTLHFSQPALAEINDGAKGIDLTTGNSVTLKTIAAPWGDDAGEVKYYSEDNSIASVDEKGVVTGHSKGTVTVYAYYPKNNISDSIEVTVSGECTTHKWEDVKVTKTATCKETGAKTQKCSVCGRTQTVSIPKDAKNHAKYGTTKKVTKEATLKAAGKAAYICKGCGKTVKTESIAKLKSSVDITVSWKAAKNAKKYKVQVFAETKAKGKAVATVTTKKASAKIKGAKLVAGKKYVVKVTALNSKGKALKQTVKITKNRKFTSVMKQPLSKVKASGKAKKSVTVSFAKVSKAKADKITVVVKNAKGKKVISKTFTNKKTLKKVVINSKKLTKGKYTINVTANSGKLKAATITLKKVDIK